jgi:Tfp pilus assembly protein PilO
MKVEMNPKNRAILAVLVVGALAAAVWIMLLAPKRDEAKKLGKQIDAVEASLTTHRAEVADAEAAREEFSDAYQQLVVLGKAVPADDDTASLLVQLNRVAERAHVRFGDFKLDGESGQEAPAPAPAPAPEEAPSSEGGATPAANLVSPTEAAASTMPLGASIGPAGLAVMPYSLGFQGGFFELADFIKGLDSMVKTTNEQVSVDGRLITIDGFSLAGAPSGGFTSLKGTFAVTTYLTPPSQGVTAGASPTGPATATPASTTIGGAP